MPVYNTELGLVDRALTSICRQTHGKLQVIVVDDGSAPELARQLDAMASGDSRVLVIHQLNRGVSSARNAGMAAATGDFVCFVDSDDYVSPTFLDSALRLAHFADLDAVFGGIRVVSRDACARWRSAAAAGTVIEILKDEDIGDISASVLSDAPSELADTKLKSATNVVGAIYSRGLVRGLAFPEGVTQGEDRVFNLHALKRARRVAFCSSTWYVYDRICESSATQSLSLSLVACLGRTVDAFADAGRLDRDPPGSEERLDGDIRRSAVDGIFGYFKVAVLVAGRAADAGLASAEIALLSTRPSVISALREVRIRNIRDWVVVQLAKRGRWRLLLLLGRLQVKVGRGAI
jgi:hypothetical protein